MQNIRVRLPPLRKMRRRSSHRDIPEEIKLVLALFQILREFLGDLLKSLVRGVHET